MNKFKVLLVASLIAIVAMTLLTRDINAKEAERVALNQAPTIKNPANNSEWAKYYPRQYDSWKQTKESNDMEDMLIVKPYYPVIWAGFRFAIDYNSPRGHYYAVQDSLGSLRTGAPVDEKTGPFPTACWACKSPDIVRIVDEAAVEVDGDRTKAEQMLYTGKWARLVKEVTNAVGCLDCHSPKTGELAMGRPYVNRALAKAGMKSFEESTHQEKRSLVCASCHVEYYFKKTEYKDKNGVDQVAMVVELPWNNGIDTLDVEKFYDEINFSDFTHAISKTPMIKAQHPEWEFAAKGIHGKKGVSCADCHMPYTQEGSVKYTDHKIGNPLDTMDRSCMTCHRESEAKLKQIIKDKKANKEYLADIAFDNLAKAHLETARALEIGATDADLKEIRTHIRHGQFRADMAVAGHGNFFHAPEEVLKLLGSGNEEAMQARIKLVKVLAKYGDINYIAPDFDTKEKSQALALPNMKTDMKSQIDAKMKFRETLMKEWLKQAEANGKLDTKTREFNNLDYSYGK